MNLGERLNQWGLLAIGLCLLVVVAAAGLIVAGASLFPGGNEDGTADEASGQESTDGAGDADETGDTDADDGADAGTAATDGADSEGTDTDETPATSIPLETSFEEAVTVRATASDPLELQFYVEPTPQCGNANHRETRLFVDGLSVSGVDDG